MPVATPAWLQPHPDTPCTAVRQLQVAVTCEGDGALRLRYTLAGDLDAVRVPAAAAPVATDGLWQHTCFELFVARPDDAGYREYNFSPSGQWAGYQFRDYRERNPDFMPPRPAMQLSRHSDQLTLDVQLPPGTLLAEARPDARPSAPAAAGHQLLLGLTAVIETTDGRRSYWALRHPPGPPDFHHRDAFALTLDLPA